MRMAGSQQSVEFFFDYSSPWTYLAFVQLTELCRRRDTRLVFKPILVGGIFNTVNPSVLEMRASKPVKAKVVYGSQDLKEWAEAYNVRIHAPYGEDKPTIFPMNSVKSLRGAFFAIDAGKIEEYSREVFASYWGHDLDISDPAVLLGIAAKVGLDRAQFADYIASPTAKELLRNSTQECVDRGGFGSPSMFVGEHMYFGNDRLPLLERRLLLSGSEAGAAVGLGGDVGIVASHWSTSKL